MRNTKRLLVAALVAIGCLGMETAFQDAEGKMSLSGRLVYVAGPSVRELDPASGRRRASYDHERNLRAPMAVVDENSFIVTDDRRMMFLVRMDGEVHALGKGYDPVFFPAHGKLLYRLYTKTTSGGHTSLYEAELRGNRLESPRAIGRVPNPYSKYSLAVSDHEALVWGGNDRYVKYDLRNGSLADTAVEGCSAKAWRARTQEVVCRRVRENEYILIGLDGRSRPVPGLSKGRLSVDLYVPEGDYLIAGQSRLNLWPFGETVDLYWYDFATDTAKRLAKNFSLWSGFWFPALPGWKPGDADGGWTVVPGWGGGGSRQEPLHPEPLHDAAIRGDAGAVKALVNAGVDINKRDEDEEATALHVATFFLRTAVVKALLTAGADVNAKDRGGSTALDYAAFRDSASMIETLLRAGADVNANEDPGKRALHYVAEKGNIRAIRTLLKAGADVNAKDRDGETALHYVARQGHAGTPELMGSGADVRAVEELLKAGADVNARNKNGDTPMYYASVWGDKPTMALLRRYGGR